MSLALAAIPPASPAASVASGAAVAVCFSPEEDRTVFAVDAINRAEGEILVNAYTLTTDSGVVEALVRAKQRDVDVKLIADRTSPCKLGSGIEPSTRGGCRYG
jgi:phosphatidylserine/phosphatidylglycerophosphate/cardiolipin synthase-like enzyme